MIANLKWLIPLLAAGLPLAASAQVSDATYCRRLTARYETFIENMKGHSLQPGGRFQEASRHNADWLSRQLLSQTDRLAAIKPEAEPQLGTAR